MDNIFLFPEFAGRKNEQPNNLQLATVAGVYEDGLALIPDAQAAATQKHYKYLASAYPAPAVGDRVVVMKMSGTYVVLGSLDGGGSGGDDWVSKSGDTMTGDLILQNARLYMDSPWITVGTIPEEDQWTKEITFRDSAQKIIGELYCGHRQNGRDGIVLYGTQTVNGVEKDNMLGLYVDDDGSGYVHINYPTAWRSALGLGSSGALPLTIGQGGTGATGIVKVTGSAGIFSSVASGFSVSSAVYAQWGKLAMVTALFVPSAAGTTTNWKTWATLASGKRPAAEIAADCSATTYCLIGTDGAITLSLKESANVGYRVSATYLLA